MAEYTAVGAGIGAGQHMAVVRNQLEVAGNYILGLVPESRNAVAVDIPVRSCIRFQTLLRPLIYALFFYAH